MYLLLPVPTACVCLCGSNEFFMPMHTRSSSSMALRMLPNYFYASQQFRLQRESRVREILFKYICEAVTVN